jgi:hypothetical protein
VVQGVVTPRRRCGRIIGVRAEAPGLAEAGHAAISRVTQHRPNDGAFRAARFAGRDTFGVEPPRDLSDTASFDCVHLIDALHDPGVGFIHEERGGSFIVLADGMVSIGSVAQHAHFARLRSMSFTASRALQDLRSFLFRDHALELYQELIFRTVTWWRVHEQCLDSMASKFLHQPNLICILAAQTVRRIREDNLDLLRQLRCPLPISGPAQRSVTLRPAQQPISKP